jgi:hypothetical protein
MSTQLFFLIAFISTSLAWSKTFELPQGKGKCPHFTFTGDDNWVLKSDRKKGDRWILLDSKTKMQIVRFDYKLPHTDQRQVPEVEDIEMNLGGFKVNKFTVSLMFMDEAVKATEGLITSYSYADGPLQGLVAMSDQYDVKDGLANKIEKILSSIKVKK